MQLRPPLSEFERARLTIVTDGEPDDLIALLLLQQAGWLAKAQIIANGWRDPQTKAAFIQKTLRLAADQIYVGLPSALDFSYGNASAHAFPPWQPELFCDALVICLAPPRELLRTDAALLRSSALALYGGFNLRCLLDEGVAAAQLLALLDAFDRVLYYEAQFAVGDSAVHDPTLLDALPAGVLRAIAAWNQHAQRYGGKIAASIAACPRQFVNADTGLVATLLMAQPACRLVPARIDLVDLGNYEPCADGRLLVVVGQDPAALAQQQIAWMRERLDAQ